MKLSTYPCIAVLLACTAQAAPSFYVINSVAVTDLGTLGGPESVALDINEAAEIVGWSHTADGRQNPFLFVGGQMQNLSFLGPQGEATGINNKTQVVGNFRLSANSLQRRAFIWEEGIPQLLPHSMPGWIDADTEKNCIVRTEASAISDSGVISGNIDITDPDGDGIPPPYCFFNLSLDPVLWLSSGSIMALKHSTPAPDSLYDVNSSGVAVGYEWATSSAVRYEGSYPQAVPYPPGSETIEYSMSHAFGVNEHGHVVGYVARHDLTPTKVVSSKHAFWWSGGGFGSAVDLGVLPTGQSSVADDVNDQDFVAGYADILVSRRPLSAVRVNRAFLYHAQFGLYLLPKLSTSGLTGACEAYSLSNRDPRSGVLRIVGFCETPMGRRAVRWDVQVAQVSMPPICCVEEAGRQSQP